MRNLEKKIRAKVTELSDQAEGIKTKSLTESTMLKAKCVGLMMALEIIKDEEIAELKRLTNEVQP